MSRIIVLLKHRKKNPVYFTGLYYYLTLEPRYFGDYIRPISWLTHGDISHGSQYEWPILREYRLRQQKIKLLLNN